MGNYSWQVKLNPLFPAPKVGSFSVSIFPFHGAMNEVRQSWLPPEYYTHSNASSRKYEKKRT